MRFHKPVGTLLLWFPTAWALWIANANTPPLFLTLVFLLGTILMRAAGCVVNDMADRHIDKHVERTRLRPLTTGELSLREALCLLSALLISALWIVLQLPILCFYYAILALAVTLFYPFCKRFFQAPQFILGLAFSLGIPMAFAASNVPASAIMYSLFVLNFAWIVAYDTIYAMADKADDLRIGVQSTAIFFGRHDQFIIFCLFAFLHITWLVIAIKMQYSWWFYINWIIALGILAYQQKLILSRNPKMCTRAFSMSAWYGGLMWCSLFGNNF